MNPGPPAPRRTLARIILLAAPFVFVIGIEAAARTVFWWKHGVPGHSYGTSQSDPEFGAMPRPYSYNSNGSLNNMAFRNTEDVFEPKPAGSLRVIAYGGSSTYCHHLLNDQAWPLVLQRELRAQGGPHERDQVLNGGVIAWSIGHILARAKREVPVLHPDVVLIYSGVNEEYNAALVGLEGPSMNELVARHEYGHFAKGLAFNTPLRNVISYKALLDVVGAAASKWRRTPPPAEPRTSVDPAIMENYLHTAEELVRFLAANHARPIFIREIYEPYGPNGDMPAKHMFSTTGAAQAAGWGATVIDPSPILKDYHAGDPPYFQDTMIHMTALGARKFARFVFEQAFAGR